MLCPCLYQVGQVSLLGPLHDYDQLAIMDEAVEATDDV